MSPLALVLASGMVVGNGPERVSEEVRESLCLDGPFKGTWTTSNGEDYEIQLNESSEGVGGFKLDSYFIVFPYAAIDEGEGKLQLRWVGPTTYRGIYRRDGDCLLISFRNARLGRFPAFGDGNGQQLLILRRVEANR